MSESSNISNQDQRRCDTQLKYMNILMPIYLNMFSKQVIEENMEMRSSLYIQHLPLLIISDLMFLLLLFSLQIN